MDIVERRRGPRPNPRDTPMFRSQEEKEEPAMKTEKLAVSK